MSTWMLIVVSSLYLFTGIEQGINKDINWLGFWASYAAANLFYLRAVN